MTKKRFMIIGENYTNIDMPVFIICKEDDCCFEVYESKEEAQRVCDKLNNLINENEQLKEAVWSWSKSYNRVYEKNELLKQRIDYLIRELKTEMATSISRNERIRLDFAITVLESLKGDFE